MQTGSLRPAAAGRPVRPAAAGSLLHTNPYRATSLTVPKIPEGSDFRLFMSCC